MAVFVNNTKKWKHYKEMNLSNMNKQAIFILGLLTLFFGTAYAVSKIGGTNIQEEKIIANEEIVSSSESNVENIENITPVVAEETKITPNTILTLKKYYKDCGHSVKDSAEVPDEMVNLTEQEVIDKYPSWKLDEFSKEEVVLTREMESFCGEHYLLKEEEGKVVIYVLDADGNKEFLETTDIAFEYIPETDKIILTNGIYVYGKEELNKIREDFES